MIRRAPLLALSALIVATPALSGQQPDDLGGAEALRRHHPQLLELLVRQEHAHGVLIGELAREGDAVRARADTTPTRGFEGRVADRLVEILSGDLDRETRRAMGEGYAVLGARAVSVVRRTQALQREIVSILADPEIEDPRRALAAAVDRYGEAGPGALPSVPKNMDVLYGHPFALSLRERYGALDRISWAGHWLRLAATEPMTDLPAGAERLAGIDTVTTRFLGKIRDHEPPHHAPTELPLAPAIAPGLIWLSPEAAMIWDNYSMMMEVIGDILASPETTDVRGAIDATVDFFLDPELEVTHRDEWELMALRHGIFFQGGFPLAVMTQNERNSGGHAHMGGGMRLMAIPGMPGGPRR